MSSRSCSFSLLHPSRQESLSSRRASSSLVRSLDCSFASIFFGFATLMLCKLSHNFFYSFFFRLEVTCYQQGSFLSAYTEFCQIHLINFYFALCDFCEPNDAKVRKSKEQNMTACICVNNEQSQRKTVSVGFPLRGLSLKSLKSHNYDASVANAFRSRG